MVGYKMNEIGIMVLLKIAFDTNRPGQKRKAMVGMCWGSEVSALLTLEA